jgi:hypothetical protein
MPYAKKEDALAWRKKWEAENKEKRKVWHKKSRERPEYKVRVRERSQRNRDERKATLLAEQGGLCAICGNPERRRNPRTGELRQMAQDHDHVTGKPRGLLCTDCNLAIGFFQDSIPTLESAIGYIKKWTT